MAEYRLFDAVTGGARENDPDALTGVSLGTEFYILNNTGRRAIRLWYWHPVGTGDTAQRVGRIYRITDQTIIVDSVTFPTGTSGTWVSVDIPATALTPNVRYKAVIWHPNGHFALTANYWTANRIISDLIGPENADAHGGGQCTYDYSTSIQYPTSTFDASNYWADVTISDVTDQTVNPTGITSTVTFGTPTALPGSATATPSGIPPGTALGQPAAAPGPVTATAAGIAPTAAAGRPVVAAAAPLGRLTAVASAVTLATGNSASVTIPADGSVQTGNLLILACVMPSGSRTFSVSGIDGFTSLTSAAQPGHTSEVWWHTVRAGDLGQAVTVTPSTGGIRQALLLARITGADLAAPVAGSAKNTSATATTKTTPPLAAAPTGSREVGLVFDSRGALTPQTANWTAPAGHTRALQAFTTSGTGASSGAMGDSDTLQSGTVGSRTWTADQQALGSAWTIAVAGAGQVLAPAAIASTAAVGTATASPGTATVTPGGIGPGVAFGSPAAAPGAVTATPAGISSGAAVGAPVLQPGAVAVAPVGVASTAGIGQPVASVGAVAAPAGVGPTAAFGQATLIPGAVTVNIGGIPPAAVLGQPTVIGGEQPPEDVDYIVGAPSGRWAAGRPAGLWRTGSPAGRWEVGAPWT